MQARMPHHVEVTAHEYLVELAAKEESEND